MEVARPFPHCEPMEEFTLLFPKPVMASAFPPATSHRHYAPTTPTAPQSRYANSPPQSYTLFWFGKENYGLLCVAIGGFVFLCGRWWSGRLMN